MPFWSKILVESILCVLIFFWISFGKSWTLSTKSLYVFLSNSFISVRVIDLKCFVKNILSVPTFPVRSKTDVIWGK